VIGKDDHRAFIVWRDDLGIIVMCSCNRWGYAGPDEEGARAAHQVHVEESGDRVV
jgi:hypothetical protein